MTVFLSYARRDLARVSPIAEGLGESGVEVWWDRRLSPGENYSIVIGEKLEQSQRVVVAWSAQARDSLWVRGEALEALDRGKLVQVLLDGARPPVPFNALHALDLSGWGGDRADPAWTGVVAAVRGAPAPASDAAPAASPKPAKRPPEARSPRKGDLGPLATPSFAGVAGLLLAIAAIALFAYMQADPRSADLVSAALMAAFGLNMVALLAAATKAASILRAD